MRSSKGAAIREATSGEAGGRGDCSEDERYLGPSTLAKLKLGGDQGDEEAGLAKRTRPRSPRPDQDGDESTDATVQGPASRLRLD